MLNVVAPDKSFKESNSCKCWQRILLQCSKLVRSSLLITSSFTEKNIVAFQSGIHFKKSCAGLGSKPEIFLLFRLLHLVVPLSPKSVVHCCATLKGLAREY